MPTMTVQVPDTGGTTGNSKGGAGNVTKGSAAAAEGASIRATKPVRKRSWQLCRYLARGHRGLTDIASGAASAGMSNLRGQSWLGSAVLGISLTGSRTGFNRLLPVVCDRSLFRTSRYISECCPCVQFIWSALLARWKQLTGCCCSRTEVAIFCHFLLCVRIFWRLRSVH